MFYYVDINYSFQFSVVDEIITITFVEILPVLPKIKKILSYVTLFNY